MKKFGAFFLAFLFVLSVTACRITIVTPESTSETTIADASSSDEITSDAASDNLSSVTFIDDLSREVTVSEPKRVAALLGSYTHIWQLAGGQVVASADDAWDDLGLPMAEDAVNLGSMKNLSLELLFSAEPDFVLASSNVSQHLEWQETLENAGIVVAYFDVKDFSDYLKLLQICTDLTGRKDLYEENGTKIKTQIDAVIEKSQERLTGSEAPTVLSLQATTSSVKAKNSDGNVLGAMLKNLGCLNIADSDDTLLEDLSIEQIISCDPDYIFIVSHGDEEAVQAFVSDLLMSQPAWSGLTAVKNDHVFFMDKTLYRMKPNNRWGEAYEKLEAIFEND